MTDLIMGFSRFFWIAVVFGAFVLAMPVFPVLAKVGVGMGAGEVRLTEPVKPGGIYTLPNLRVFNTGDETTTYGMNVAYHQDRPEMRPGKKWFNFSPDPFTLEPGKSQVVEVVMVVPVKTTPGEYFAFLESGPVPSDKPGTSVGVAVATKLFFTVEPANLWQAITHRISAFFRANAPWSWIVLAVVAAGVVLVLFKKFFSFNVSFRKK